MIDSQVVDTRIETHTPPPCKLAHTQRKKNKKKTRPSAKCEVSQTRSIAVDVSGLSAADKSQQQLHPAACPR